MFEDFVKKKIDSELNIVSSLPEFTKENLLKSSLSDFTKNYLLTEAGNRFAEIDYKQFLEKSNKLYFNYTLRPKWTLLTFLFGNFESRHPEDIVSKLEFFPFYKFYTDSIREFIKQNSQIFFTKNEIRSVIDETNMAIYEKLTSDISNEKIKNFFMQLFKLKYNGESGYNLESAVPFSFIKIFLADKSYDELKNKFQLIPGISDETEISLKDIIKILTDKFTLSEKENIPSIVTDKKLPSAEIKKENDSIRDIKKEKLSVKTEAGNVKKIYSDELLQADQKISKSDKTEEIKSDSATQVLNGLFNEKKMDKIIKEVYNSDLISKEKSFKKLAGYKTWNEASVHLIEIFRNNRVDIYNKTVLSFTNELEEYYKRTEK